MAYERVHWANGATALSAEHMNNIEDGIEELISGKVDKVSGKDLSTNDYTTAEKTKLAGVATGAEVNQNAFSNVKVGSTTIAADSKTDTLELVAGSNVTLTPDATNDKVTIASRYSEATIAAAGLMSAADKTKLNGIAAEANKIAFVSVPMTLTDDVTIPSVGMAALSFRPESFSGTFIGVTQIILKTGQYQMAMVSTSSVAYNGGVVEIRAVNNSGAAITISKTYSSVTAVFATGA